MLPLRTLTALSAALALAGVGLAGAPAHAAVLDGTNRTSNTDGTTRQSLPTRGATASPSYPVPAGAIYVDRAAASGGDGTQARPLTTIQAAVNKARAGATIVIRGGHYDESVEIWTTSTVSRNKLTIQNYPGEEVWLDGTRAVSGWSKNTDGTWSAKWTNPADFNVVAGYGTSSEVGSLSFTDGANPVAADASQLFNGTREYQQVPSAPKAGQFSMKHSSDLKTAVITLGEDPTGKSLRASGRVRALISNATDLTLRGFRVHGYATPLNKMGSVFLGSAHRARLRDIRSDDSPTTPIYLAGSQNSVIENVTVLRAGVNSLGMRKSTGTIVRNSRFLQSNDENFRAAPVSAGVKLAETNGLVIDNNEFTGTRRATGLWLDVGCGYFTITRNTVRANAANGIEVEIGFNGIIAGNSVTDNGENGIQVYDTPNVTISNNLIAGSGGAKAGVGSNLMFLQDSRRLSTSDPNNTRVTKNITVVNNAVGSTGKGADNQINAIDYAQKISAEDMAITFKGNVFSDESTVNFARWAERATATNGGWPTYASFAAFQGKHGDDMGSTNKAFTWWANSYGADATAQDIGQPVALTDAVADALHVPRGTVHLSIF